MKSFLMRKRRPAYLRPLLLMLLLAAILPALAQEVNKLSISTQLFMSELKGEIDPDDAPQRARARQLGLRRVNENTKYDRFVAKPDTINGVVYMSAFVRVEDESAVSELEALGVVIQERFLQGKLFTTLIPVDKIEAVAEIAKVSRVNAATMMRPATDVARQETNTDDVLTYSVDAQSAGLPNGFDGSGVVLGVIDTGIDFQHIAFKDASGNSRIKRAYVYNGSSAQEYTTISSTVPTTDTNTEDHGTHTSSTAGGSSVIMSGTHGSTVTVTDNHANATYGGMAPGADLYLAGVNGLNDTYLSNAVNKMCTYADQQGKPLVVSNSWGSQWGPHDGTGEVADIYNDLFGDTHPNRVALFAASNDGGKSKDNEGGGYHLTGTATSANPLGAVLRSASYSNTDAGYFYQGLIASAWARNTNVTKLAVKIIVLNAKTGAELASTTVTSAGAVSGLSSYYSGSLYVYYDQEESDKTQVILYSSNGITSRSTSTTTKNGEAYYTSNYTLAIQVYPYTGASSSVVDVWGGSYGYFTSHLSTNGYNWTNGSDDMSVSDEATIANVISIGAYVTKNQHVDYTGTTQSSSASFPTIGDIAYFSSYATASKSPTGLQYPWITAPGARLIAAVNHYHTSNDYNYINGTYAKTDRVNANTTYPYGAMQGTSMATPTAAGIVALWMQASLSDNAKDEYKNLTVNKVKQLMATTAIHDSFTDTGANASHFGNGKIDALAGIEEILDNNSPRITATPSAVAFGNQVAGGTYTQTFTVTGANLEGNITLAKSGSSAFTISQTSVAKATAEGDGATITVTFKPTAYTTADYTGTVTLTSSNATTVTVALTGKGVYAAPVIAANPTSLTFTGNSGSTYTKTVTITGSNLQGNITAAIQNDANGYYSVSPTSFTASPQTVTVTWHPTAGGNSTANLVLTTTGTGANSVTVPLSGTAQGPTITANPTNVTFADAYATRTYTKTVTVTGTNLSQNITASISGANVYSIDKTSLGTSGGTITVTYAPTAAGTTNATLSLSSNGASTVTVPITGTAQAATPTLIVSPTSLSFTADAEQQTTQTFAVTGRFISGDVALTVSGTNGNMFTVSPATIPASSIDDTTPVTVTVTFNAPADDGTYTGTVTLTSEGAESQTVALNAEVSTGGTASDAYLDIAKYATIDEAGWRTALVNNLYKYTEYSENGIAWLTLPTYGAFVGARYSTTSSTVGSGHPQAWIECSLGTNNTYAGTTWTSEASYTNPFNGSSAYFTSATARAIGYNSRSNTEVRTISYYVTNTTAVKLSGTGRNGTNATYPASLKVYECTKNGDNLIPSTTATKSLTNSSTTTFTLTADDLEASKIYKVETSIYRGYMYEIAFQTPLNKPSLSVTPSELSIKAAPGETATATFNVKGRLLTDNVAVTLTDQNGVFAVNPTNISISDAQAGSEVTVSFSSETEGTFTGTVTVVSGNLSETISLIGVSADGGTASDNYLNIAKYATINAAGWPTSSIENLYQYKEYPEDDCAWLTVANYGVNIASDTQKWFTPNTIKSSAGSWDATDIFFGDDTYFGATGTSYYANWTEDYQDFYVTNCTLVKQYAYNSSSNYPLIMTIYECTENADGTLTAGTTAVQTIQSTVYSATELITSSTLDASKIYKIRVYNDYSRLYEIGFQTPLTKPTLTIDPEELDFIAEPGQMQTQTFTLTGMRLTEDVTLTLSDEKGVYDISVSSVSRADASAGVEVTVTFNAPEYEGSYRAQVMVSSGEASAQLGLYGSVGKPGSAYSRYLDIANYGTISTGNWYVDVIDNPYKYTEYATDQVAWLTMPVYMAREAWLYNDQNWVGNYNNYYIHVSETEGLAWDATDVFPGDDYYFTSTKSYGLGQVSTTNTDLAYTYYNVTNCTQVKAYGYNTSGTTSSYPAFIQIFELTENTDGTLTMSETRTDIQSTYTTSSDVTMTSIELDPAKIYRVYVGGARSYFYEVAFRTPLPDEKTLAELVDAGVEQQHYKIVAGDLRLVYVSGDSKKLYCKDDNQFASKSIIEEGQIDYVKTKAGLQNGDWDQSNWVVLYNSAGWSNEVVPLMGRRLKGVSGQFTDRTNPTVATSLVPQIYDDTEQAVNYMENVNTYITCNFLGTTQTGSDGNTYFFVTPKPMEIAQINWAMWDEETGCFVIPPATGSSNQAHLDGGFYANDSEYDGTMPELRDGYVYNFVGMVRHEQVASSSIKAPRKAGVSNSYVVYPLSGMIDVGRVEGDVITAVSDLKAGAAVEVARYNVAGQRVDKNYRGVVIVMMSDGTSRKVVVR